MKRSHAPSFADLSVQARTDKMKNNFLDQMDRLIDWKPISKLIDKYDKRNKKAIGNPHYDGLLLFKMLLLQNWFGLSDYQLEERTNDSISFSRFCGLSMNEVSPDHSTISRFRTAMTQAGIFDRLLDEINRQLESHHVLVQNGAIIDASIVPTPFKPKGKPTYELTDNNDAGKGDEEGDMKLKKIEKKGVDTKAGWTKKNNTWKYGYKKNYITNEEGLVLAVVTTPANVHDSQVFEELLDKSHLPSGVAVKADKAYYSEKNAKILEERGLINHIQKKGFRNHPLTEQEKSFNKEINKIRFKIERTFGSIKRWFRGGVARYRGREKVHTQNVMEAICYNLYRAPRIGIS